MDARRGLVLFAACIGVPGEGIVAVLVADARSWRSLCCWHCRWRSSPSSSWSPVAARCRACAPASRARAGRRNRRILARGARDERDARAAAPRCRALPAIPDAARAAAARSVVQCARCGLRCRRLQEAGFGPIEALDIEPLLADIELQAAGSPRCARCTALQQRRVVIIAHSMGGLIARALLRDFGASVIRRIVTIGSPHHGTVLAHGLPWADTRQMARTSSWLRS